MALKCSGKARELIAASQAGEIAAVKTLLAGGALPNAADELGQRPLIVAVAEGHAEIVRLLLQGGASPNVKGPQGRTPLGLAAAAGHPGIVRLLLRAGADIDARSDNRATALHEAVRFDHPGIVRVLLAAAPDPEPLIATGRITGEITREPVGANGFGFDPVMYIPEFGQTFAQLPVEVKNANSHRGKATRQMIELMRERWL